MSLMTTWNNNHAQLTYLQTDHFMSNMTLNHDIRDSFEQSWVLIEVDSNLMWIYEV